MGGGVSVACRVARSAYPSRLLVDSGGIGGHWLYFAGRSPRRTVRDRTAPAACVDACHCVDADLAAGYLTAPLWYIIWGAFLPLFYTTLLSVNIFAVAASQGDRIVPLVRAASTASFVATIATSFLFFSFVYSVDSSFLWQLCVVFVVTTLLCVQYLWSLSLGNVVLMRTVQYSALIGFLLLQVALVASFFPITFAPRALILSTSLYSMLGIARQQVLHTLKMRVVMEYAFVIAVVVTVVSVVG